MNFRNIIALCKKDAMIEFRQQHAVYGILLYVAATIFVLYLSFSPGTPDARTWNALFWITQLFVVTNAVAKSFLGDSKGRQLYYYTIANPVDYIFSKLIGNTLLMIVLSLVSIFLYSLLLGSPVINGLIFFGIAVLGGVSLSLVFTLLSAIASKAQQQASLMAILGFPIIIPQLVLLIRLSKASFGEVFRPGVVLQLTGLLTGLDLMIVILSAILFPYLWKD
ncbi:MAG: heme exporter protein CcmB [Chitinophagaceae bacterium]